MIPKEYLLPIIGMLLSMVLFGAQWYQHEIIFIGIQNDWGHYDFPFYLYSCSFEMARDFWDMINFISLILAVYSGAIFNGRRTRRNLK